MNLAASAVVPAMGSSRSVCSFAADFRFLQDFHDVAIDLFGKRRRRAGRARDGEPGDGTEAGDSRFGDRRDFRHVLRSFRAGDAEQLQLAGTVERHRGRQRVEEHVDIAGHHVSERGLRTVIRHMHHLDAAEHFKLAARQVRGRTDALRGEGELAGVGLAVGDQVLNCLGGKIRPHRQHIWDLRQQRDRHELRRVVFEVVIKQLLDRQWRRRTQEQRVAVGGGVRRVLGADVHRRSWHILDDDGLAPFLAELVGDQPRQNIGRRSGQDGEDNFYDMRRIGILGVAGRRHQNGGAKGKQPRTYFCHVLPRNRAFAPRRKRL